LAIPDSPAQPTSAEGGIQGRGSTVKIYPDAAHGFLFQHHVKFAADVSDFLAD
jgi:hypothetical protein